LLKKQGFHKDNRRIGFIPFNAFTDGIVSQEQTFDFGPINDAIDFFHSFDGSVLFHGSKKRDIGEGEIGFHIFEAHDDSSKGLNLDNFYQKNMGFSSNIINNIKILSSF